MKCFLLLCGFFMSSFSFAGEYYPERLAPRLLGTSQGLAGDCMAEAEVNALEQAFAIRGLPVRLSLFYRHAFNWRSKSFTAPDLRLALDDADQRLMDRAGGMIPEYMWPEDGKGYPEVDTKRPHPARIVAFDPAFPVFDSFGFKREWQGFAPGYSNSIDLDTLKRRIAGGEAITLSIHGDLLEPPGGTTWSTSPVTGLIYGRYSLASLKKGLGKKTLKEGFDHEVQVIGYDDSIYADGTYRVPGAILIRNTWNSDLMNQRVFDPDENQRLAEDLRKFRLKIHPTNLPGFYAIPLQYLADLISEKTGGMDFFSLDFKAYAAAYQRFRDRYQIINAPFTCEEKSLFDPGSWSRSAARDSIRDYRGWVNTYRDRTSTPGQIRSARSNILNLAAEAASDLSKPWSSKFISYAKLSRNLAGGPDRVRDFYAGAFTAYYCNKPGETRIWPSHETTDRGLFQLALDELSLDAGSPAQWNKMLYALSELEADLTP